jgi:hypothetical protein
MIRLLNPDDENDIVLFRQCLDQILFEKSKSYSTEGLSLTFDWYIKWWTSRESDPHKNFFVAAEIDNDKIVRFIVTSSLNKLWSKPVRVVPYFSLLFWYTAPGHTPDVNVFDNEVGRLAFDPFINQGMYYYFAIMQGPRTKEGIKIWQEKMYKKVKRIDVYIDRYIDTQEKLDQLKEDYKGFYVVLPSKLQSPLLLYTGFIKPEFRPII